MASGTKAPDYCLIPTLSSLDCLSATWRRTVEAGWTGQFPVAARWVQAVSGRRRDGMSRVAALAGLVVGWCIRLLTELGEHPHPNLPPARRKGPFGWRQGRDWLARRPRRQAAHSTSSGQAPLTQGLLPLVCAGDAVGQGDAEPRPELRAGEVACAVRVGDGFSPRSRVLVRDRRDE